MILIIGHIPHDRQRLLALASAITAAALQSEPIPETIPRIPFEAIKISCGDFIKEPPPLPEPQPYEQPPFRNKLNRQTDRPKPEINRRFAPRRGRNK